MFLVPFVITLFAPFVRPFTFTLDSSPTQCGNVTVSWTDGHPPYELMILPVDFLYRDGRLLYDYRIESGNTRSFTVNYRVGTRFLVFMSDATGAGTGGTSDIMTVGDGPSSCISETTTRPNWFFYFDPATLIQCGNLAVAWDRGGVPPITMWGVIQGGNTFSLGSSTSTSLHWRTNVRAGTPIMFIVGDSNARGSGGRSDLLTIGDNSDSSCLGPDSPGTTPAPAAGQISTSAPQPSQTSPNPSASIAGSPPDSSSPAQNPPTARVIHIAAIAGGAAGGIVGLVLLAVFVFCLHRRRRATSETSFRKRDTDLLASPQSMSQSLGGSPTRSEWDTVPMRFHVEPFITPRASSLDTSAPSKSPVPAVGGASRRASSGTPIGNRNDIEEVHEENPPAYEEAMGSGSRTPKSSV